MAPSESSRTSSRMNTRRKLKPRKSHSHCKKKHHHLPVNDDIDNKNEEIISTAADAGCSSSSISSNVYNNESPRMIRDTDIFDDDDQELNINEVSSSSSTACSTPKAQRFQIPEISTCPPAPKKPKSLSNCSLHTSPMAFFSPPELELFFLVALPDISV